MGHPTYFDARPQMLSAQIISSRWSRCETSGHLLWFISRRRCYKIPRSCRPPRPPLDGQPVQPNQTGLVQHTTALGRPSRTKCSSHDQPCIPSSSSSNKPSISPSGTAITISSCDELADKYGIRGQSCYTVFVVAKRERDVWMPV